ncbi:hypothetical protein PIB30_090976 [Stylosanthes scabra]|uniref:Uncharacterized protein n=1 Tax=Stylosanthes scabra TaxID=79078 RepID=A0ABU6QUS0_9FABA|nr:hypothetical protein [Stylosanthes scabra]
MIGSHPRFVYFDPHVDGKRDHIIYYEIEKREKYEDSDERSHSNLAVGKTRRYHFEDEPFIHPFHSVRFDLDRWMCKGDDVEGKEACEGISEREDDAKGIEEEGKNDEEEEDPEEDAPEEKMSTIPRTMDVDNDEEYLQYLEELRRHPEYSPIHSSQAFA